MKNYRQLIFIDDSGDPGFKFKRGSSSLFVIVCVVFDSKISAEYTSASIKMLKKNMGWRQEREFKFHRANDEQKKAFFENVKGHDFRIRAIVIDKNRILEPDLRKSDSFYCYVIKKVLEDYDGMDRARVFLDGSGNKSFRKRIASEMRKNINVKNHRMVEFRLVDSKDEPLVQLADMIAGAINAKYDKTKRYRHDYLRMIKAQIDEIRIAR